MRLSVLSTMTVFIVFFYFAIIASFHEANGKNYSKRSLDPLFQLRLNALMENAVAEVNKQVKINGTPVIKISDISKNIAVQTLGTGYFNATNGCFGSHTDFNVTKNAVWNMDFDIEKYSISSRIAILKPQFHYDFSLKFPETISGNFSGCINEAFLDAELKLSYNEDDCITMINFDNKTTTNITIGITTPSQLPLPSEFLKSMIMSAWKYEIASSLREQFLEIMNDVAKNFNCEELRPFVRNRRPKCEAAELNKSDGR